jgi:vacuolar-type H+-ATPase subunit H
MSYEPDELLAVEREEEDARLRLEEARERRRRSGGEAPSEDHDLLERLEAEWKHALDRLHRARGSGQG